MCGGGGGDGGGHNIFGVGLAWVHEVLAILKGSAKGFRSLKGGREDCYPVFSGGGWAQKVSDPPFSRFVAPPPFPRN